MSDSPRNPSSTRVPPGGEVSRIAIEQTPFLADKGHRYEVEVRQGHTVPFFLVAIVQHDGKAEEEFFTPFDRQSLILFARGITDALRTLEPQEHI